jgi:hypothetical protein
MGPGWLKFNYVTCYCVQAGSVITRGLECSLCREVHVDSIICVKNR